MLRRIMALLVLGSLLLAACGGDDGGSDEADGGGATTGGDVGEVTGGDGGDGDGDVGIFDAGRCAEVVAAMASAANAIPAAMSGSAADLEQSVEAMQAFAAEAPEEIREDFQLLAEAYARIGQALADSGYDPASGQPPSAEAMAALQEAGAELNTEEFQAASERISAYFEAECPG
jgi:predicted small secreted protein